MSKNKIFLIVQSALCVLVAAMLATSAIRIFVEGSAWQAAGHPSDWVYTREKIVSQLLPILPLILASIAMTIYGLVKGISDEDADKPVADVEISRDLMVSRIAEPSEEMSKERDLQKKLQLGGWIGFAICMIPILLYITNGDHFALTDASGLDFSIIGLFAFVIPWTVAGLACLIASTILQEKSMQRETDAAKAAKAAAPQAAKAAAPLVSVSPEAARRRVIIRYVLMAAAVVFIILGVQNGSMKDVLVKAIRICTECVGLG